MNFRLDKEFFIHPGSPSEEFNPLDVIKKNHKFHNYLCDAVEEIADSLPDKADTDLCQRIINVLPVELFLHQIDEELGLFPLLEKRSQPEDHMSDVINELIREHLIDTDQAAELMIPMSKLASGEKPDNPDEVGYIFRRFFESYRRHLIWETEFILPLASKKLLFEDLANLNLRMFRNRKTSSKLVGYE